jgi:hypothetical protein
VFCPLGFSGVVASPLTEDCTGVWCWGVVSRCVAVEESDRLFLGVYLVSDLLTSGGFLMTRTSPRRSPASSGSAGPSFGRVARSCSARGQHAPGRFLPVPAREGYCMISRVWLVVFSVFGCLRRSSGVEEVPGVWHV